MISKSKIINIKKGKNLKIIEPVNIYGTKFGNNVFVGPFTEIQKNVTIGNNCKIQSHSFICEFVTIGNNCFISHGAMFINDKFSDGHPAYGNKKKWKKTKISNNVCIGTNATILPVTICSNVVIGAGSVVTKDIKKPGKYAGNPAILIAK
jgi:acetyltransferase-like isoleucine patch superfamily enzyme